MATKGKFEKNIWVRKPAKQERWSADAQNVLKDEVGTIRKTWSAGLVPIALVYPNTYYIGMSNLGLQTIYGQLNERDDIVCERAFLPELLEGKRGIYSVESGRHLRDFAVIAFSLSYELDYFNIVRILEMSGIPVLATDRREGDPIIIAGGPGVTGNPEPVAPFFDALGIGEAEPLFSPLLSQLPFPENQTRRKIWETIAQIPGWYVPALSEPYYQSDGNISAVPQPVERQRVKNVHNIDTRTRIITPHTEFGDTFLIEVARGCPRVCRFCLASFTSLPKRERSVDELLAMAAYARPHLKKIGLVSASLSDYSHVDELVVRLADEGYTLGLASMRAQVISPVFLTAVARAGVRNITIAPEGGTDRMREVIHKNLTESELVNTVHLIASHGIKQIKLYFIAGLPTETPEDIAGIAETSLLVKRTMEEHHKGSIVKTGVSCFIPKAQTPFQWSAQPEVDYFKHNLAYLQKRLLPTGVQLRTDSPRYAMMQAVMARGDRRVHEAIIAAVHIAGTGEVTVPIWDRGCAAVQLDQYFYTREIPENALLPWSHVSMGMREGFLNSEWEKARAPLNVLPEVLNH